MQIGCSLAGCKVAFLVVNNSPTMENKSIIAMDMLKNSGVKQVKPIKGYDDAARLYAEIQKSPKAIQTNVFFKLNGKDVIVPVFNQASTF